MKKINLKNPQTKNGTTTWDCVYFGHYPQSADGKDGFKNEPIKWRVLSVNGNDAFLLADKNIDSRIPYNEEFTGVTWETCTMRNWLNSSFMNKAFSNGEQSAIRTTNVVNKDNPKHGTEGGNNTQDKVFLLSIEEVMKPAYGFPSNYDGTETRKAVNTAYTASKNSYMNSAGSRDYWWLRSPGYDSFFASGVHYYGDLSYNGIRVNNSYDAVRPALHLNLSSNLWSYAGTVSSDETEEENEK